MNILEQIYLWTHFSLLSHINMVVELLGHKLGECVNLFEAAKPFFKVILPLYTLTSNQREISLFSSL